jgi:rubrerythrin
MEKQTRAHGISVTITAEKQREALGKTDKEISSPKLKLWYCKQCGYVVFREDPPYICPICKAKREFFAEIKISINANT